MSSHHQGDMPSKMKHKLASEFEKMMEQGDAMEPAFGPLRDFPEGMYGKDDEGALSFGVAADPKNEKVVINFNSPVHWMAMNPDQAANLGHKLIEMAEEASSKKLPV